jgi:hypothetical protein
MEIDVDKFYDRLNTPVYRCARFYGYYYLYAVRNMDDKRKIVENAASIQKEAFKHYGRYAVAGELSNVSNGAIFSRDKISKILRENTTESIVRRMDDAWYKHIYGEDSGKPYAIHRDVQVGDFFDTISPNIPNQVAHKIVEEHIDDSSIQYILNTFDSIEYNSEDVREYLWELLKQFNYAPRTSFSPTKSQVKDFIKQIRNDTFLLHGDGKFFPGAKTMFEGLNWFSNFGGEAWYSISSVLNDIDEYSDITAVDMLWGLQHNNNLWMDKIPLNGKDNYLVRAGKELKQYLGDDYVMGEHIDLAPPNPENPGNYVTEDVLQRFLDVRRSGEFYKVWPYITEVNPNAKVGLDNYEDVFKQAGK